MNNNEKREFILKEIERLEEELSTIGSQWEDNDETVEEELDIQVGDYIIYTDNEIDKVRIAELCENEDFNYQCYYPLEKLIGYCAWQSREELYDVMKECYEDLMLVQIENNQVSYLECDEEYLLFTEGECHIAKCLEVEEGCKFMDAYNQKEITAAMNLDDLLLELIGAYSIIKKVRKENNTENILDPWECKSLWEYMNSHSNGKYIYVQLDNADMTHICEEIFKHSGLDELQISDCISGVNHCEEHIDLVTEIVDYCLDVMDKYTLNREMDTWFPNDMWLEIGMIVTIEDVEYRIIEIEDRYGLIDDADEEMYPTTFSNMQEIYKEVYQ